MDRIYELETFTTRLKISEPMMGGRSVYPSLVAAILKRIYKDLDADQEHFCLLSLDIKNHVRAYKVLFSGGMTSSNFDIQIVFRTALLFGASGIIIAHNHPAGDPEPSAADRQLTERIAQVGGFLNIALRDHIILGGKHHFSFSEQGLLKDPTGWDKIRTCYHRFSEEILEEIKGLLPLADPVTRRRVRRLLRDRGASAMDWKRLKLSKSEELRIRKEHFLAQFIDMLRNTETVDTLEVLEDHIKTARRIRENEKTAT
jgi:hypothetical protein